MTSANARTAANVVLILVGVTAAYRDIDDAVARRPVFRGLQLRLGGRLPGYLLEQTSLAWPASGQARLPA
jgi:hypothetical protein